MNNYHELEKEKVEDSPLTAKFHIINSRQLKSLPKNADKIVMTKYISRNYIKQDSSEIYTSKV